MAFLRFFFFHLVRDPLYLFWYIVRRVQWEYRIGVQFYSMEQLFSLLKNERKSLIRMGDGEAYLIHHGSIGYEPYSRELRADLLKTITEYKASSPYILCLPEMDINKSNKELIEKNRFQCWLPLKVLYSQIFPKDTTYGDAVTFYYWAFRTFFSGLIQWRKLIIVTNKDIINSLNHDFLKGIIWYDTIITPDTNSYCHKAEIIQKIQYSISDFTNPEILLILACWPLSKALAYEFSNQWVQSIDIGRWIELISSRSDGNLEFLL